MATTYEEARQSLERVRQKYPEYGDMDDDTLASKLSMKFPEYADLTTAIRNPPVAATPINPNVPAAPAQNSDFGNFWKAVSGTVANTGLGIVRAADTAINLPNILLSRMQGQAPYQSQVARDVEEKLRPNVQAAYQYDPESKAGFAGELAGNLAMMVPAVASGGAPAVVQGTAALLGAGQFGSVQGDVSSQRAEAAARGKPNPVLVENELGAAALSAAAEFIFERIGIGSIAKVEASALKNAVANKVFQYAKSAGINVSEEAATQLAQNAIDIHLLNAQKEYTEGVGRASVGGGIIGVAGRGLARGIHAAQGRNRSDGDDRPVDPSVDVSNRNPDPDVAQLAVPVVQGQTSQEVAPPQPVAPEFAALMEQPVSNVRPGTGTEAQPGIEVTASEAARVAEQEGSTDLNRILNPQTEQAGKPAEPTKTPGGKDILPKPPRGSRNWSFSKLKEWAADAGYQAGKLHNLNSLRRGITQQRSNSMIDLPRPPRSREIVTSFKKYKYWAEQSGYQVEGIETKKALVSAIQEQRKAAIRQVRQKPSRVVQPTTADQARIKELEARIDKLSRSAVTGGLNRHVYEERTEAVRQRADATKKPFSVIVFDAANLKTYNDKLGEEAGNDYLRRAMKVIDESTRGPSSKRVGDAFHYGGDEYAVVLPDTDEAGAAVVRDRIEKAFGRREIVPGVSDFLAGDIATYKPGSGENLASLTNRASAAMKTRKTAMKKAAGEATSREEASKSLALSLNKGGQAAKQATPVEGTEHPRRVPNLIEQFITPLASRVRDLSPRIFNRMMRMEFDTGVQREKLKRELHNSAARITDSLGGKRSKKYRTFKRHVLNSERNEARSLLPDAVHEDFDKFYTVRRQLLKQQRDAGVPIGDIGEDSWARFIKDYRAFEAVYGDDKGRFEDAWELARQVKGRRVLTAEEKAEIANNVSQGYGPRKPGAYGPVSARERRIEKITDEQLDHYIDPLEAAFRYVDGATYAAARSKFLGRNHDLSELQDTVGQIVQAEVDEGRLGKEGQQELIDLLNTRFTADMLTMSKAARTFKQAIYMVTLGQFRSTITQLTDVAITAATHDIPSTARGVKAALNLGPSDHRFVMEDIGIHDHGEEFKDIGQIAKATDQTLRATGFKRVDRFGKESRINAAWQAMRQAAKATDSAEFKRLEREYRPVLESQFDQTMADLKAGAKSENVKYLLFLDLAKTQPVTLSQMPERYLKMADGRIMYSLKTFTIQQLDHVRRDMVRKLATPGERREGLRNLSRYVLMFGLLGMGKELLQDLLRGEEINPDQIPDRSMDALLGVVGINRYTVEKAWSKPSEAAMNLITPPLSWLDSAWKDVSTAGDGGLRTIRHIPLVGELVYYWAPFGRGFQLTKDKAKQEYRGKLKELRREIEIAVRDGDPDMAASLMVIYNERRKEGPGDGRKTPLTLMDVREGMGRQDRKEKEKKGT